MSSDFTTAKNRLQLAFRPGNRITEVDWPLGLRAPTIDSDQGRVRWLALADLEGKELCVSLKVSG